MTVDLAAEAPAGGPGVRRPARTLVAAALVLALVVAAVVGAWWWRHPRAFHATPESPSLGLGDVRPAGGEPLHVTMAWPLSDVDGSVTLHDAEAHVVSNSADAVLTFQVCVPSGRASISSVYGDLSRHCDVLAPLSGASLPLGLDDSAVGPRAQVVMTIQSGRPGELRVQGIDLDYEHGLQRGTQRVGDYVWLRYD